MSSISVIRTDDKTIISIDGPFTAEMHAPFRNAYRDEMMNENDDRHIVVDLAKTEYVDSSAMGMLLLMRAYTRNEVEIIHVRPEVLKILNIAHFERMFKIS